MAHAPALVRVGGTMQLVYELHLTNASAHDLAIDRIDVRDAERGGASLASFERARLAEVLGAPAVAAADSTPVVPAGTRAVAYFWFPVSSELPRVVTHRITFRKADGTGVEEELAGGTAQVVPFATSAGLGPPLRGGPWVALYDPLLERGHRRVPFANDGAFHIPARFAIDWIQIDVFGRRAQGDISRTSNHHGYGAEVLAVADAIVVAMRDGIPDRATLAFVPYPPEDEAGNYVTLEARDGRFITYEHLMAGSLRVAVGDRVRRGDVIARLGFSGSGASPHLHLHVSDGPSPVTGEGVPWALENFEVLGAYPSIAAFFDGGPWSSPRGLETERRMELPAANSVVVFH